MLSALFNWSDGKDSALAMYKIMQQKEFTVYCLLTSVNAFYDRVTMHGVRTQLLKQRAQHIGIPLYQLLLPEMPTMEVYEKQVLDTLRFFEAHNIRHSIFGDIFLEDLRTYRESQLGKANWKAVFPLWNMPTSCLMEEFINLGFKTIVVCMDTRFLDKSFAGRIINKAFIKDLSEKVDVRGENREYHSFVFDGPIFQKPTPISIGETVYCTFQTNLGNDEKDKC